MFSKYFSCLQTNFQHLDELTSDFFPKDLHTHEGFFQWYYCLAKWIYRILKIISKDREPLNLLEISMTKSQSFTLCDYRRQGKILGLNEEILVPQQEKLLATMKFAS